MKRKKKGAFSLLILVLAAGILGGLEGCAEDNTEPTATVTPAASTVGTGPFVGYIKDSSADTFEVVI
jgi:hypothetical protein